MIKKFLVILLLPFIISCENNRTTINNSAKDNPPFLIEISYLSFGLTTPSSIDCGTLEAYKHTNEITGEKYSLELYIMISVGYETQANRNIQ